MIGDTDKKAHTFWPVMTMLLALCPDLIVKGELFFYCCYRREDEEADQTRLPFILPQSSRRILRSRRALRARWEKRSAYMTSASAIPCSPSLSAQINFIESIHSAFYSTKLSNSAKRACLDLVELASLLPSDIEHAGLLMWVSDFAGDLQDQLLNGKETPVSLAFPFDASLFSATRADPFWTRVLFQDADLVSNGECPIPGPLR